MAKLLDNVSWRDNQDERDLRKYAKDQAEAHPGGFAGFVKTLIRAHRDGQTLTLEQLREVVRQVITEGGGAPLPAKVEAVPLHMIEGLFK